MVSLLAYSGPSPSQGASASTSKVRATATSAPPGQAGRLAGVSAARPGSGSSAGSSAGGSSDSSAGGSVNVEFAVSHPGGERLPLGRGEDQFRAVRILGIADGDHVIAALFGALGHGPLDAVGLPAAAAALGPRRAWNVSPAHSPSSFAACSPPLRIIPAAEPPYRSPATPAGRSAPPPTP